MVRPGNWRVLIAESGPETRLELKALTEEVIGAEVTVVQDGGEALATLEEEGYGFDLLVLEASMPRASGLDVLSAVDSARPELPVVVFGGPEDEQVARALGAAAFFATRSKAEALAGTLRALRRSRRVALTTG